MFNINEYKMYVGSLVFVFVNIINLLLITIKLFF